NSRPLDSVESFSLKGKSRLTLIRPRPGPPSGPLLPQRPLAEDTRHEADCGASRPWKAANASAVGWLGLPWLGPSGATRHSGLQSGRAVGYRPGLGALRLPLPRPVLLAVAERRQAAATLCALRSPWWLGHALVTCLPDTRHADEETDDARPKRQERQEPRAKGTRSRVGPKTDRGRTEDAEQRPTPKDEETETYLHEARLQICPHQASSVTRRPNAGGEPRPRAAATQERRLLGVGSSAML